MFRQIILFIALVIVICFHVNAQTHTSKKTPVKKQAATIPPDTSATKLPTITITLPFGDMQMLIGSASYGFNSYIMSTPIPANKLQEIQKYYNDTVFPKALKQYNTRVTAYNDSLARVRTRADSVNRKSKQ